jgi:hypothetical protein
MDRREAAPDIAARVGTLREALSRRGLAGFIVPRADEHQSEYVPANAQRLAWLTGFTGSAGLAIVLADRAAIFVDGRYTLQVRGEVPAALFEYRHLIEQPAAEWVAVTLQPGQALGYDPWLHTVGELERYEAAAAKAGGSLVAVSDNLVDEIWHDRPPAPLAPIVAHELRFAGKPATEKRHEIAAAMTASGVDRLAAQRPRRRRSAHALAAVLRHPRQRCLGRAFRRPAQAGGRPREPSRQRGGGAAAGAVRPGARSARRRRQARPARSRLGRRLDLRAARRRRCVGPARG